VAPVIRKGEFPVGHGSQDYWIGEPIEASTLSAIPLRDRVELVLSAINMLGVPPGEEVPRPPDPEMADRVARWQRVTGTDEAFAVAWQVLEAVAEPSADTRILRAAAQSGGYRSDGTPHGDWLAACGRRLFGPNGPAGPEVGFPAPTSPGDRAVTVSAITVGRSTHPHLADHAIAGKPVVPVAYAVEWFARAAVALDPNPHLVELVDLAVLQGVVLDGFEGGDDLRLDVTARTPAGSTGGSRLRLDLIDATTGRSRYRCSSTWSNRPVTPPPSTGAGPAVPAGRPPRYGDVLFHGPSFQMIESVAIGPRGEMSAGLRGVVDLSWPAEAWVTDPVLVDGALQLALLWTEQVLGRPSLPTGVARVRSFAGPAAGRHAAILAGRHATADRVVCDVVIRDQAGAAVIELLGIETVALTGGTG